MLIDENDHKLSENGQRKYLILVDDNSELLRAMSEFLRESLGYDDVQTFESVEEAISFLDDSKQIDVILMDQKMQGDEGAGIMAISKLHEIRPFIPIIIYTNTSYDMGREAIEKGAAAYIRRSDVSYEILAHIIDSAIYTARLEREVVRLKRLEKIMDCVGAEIMVVNEGMEIELVNEFKRKKRNVNEDDIRNCPKCCQLLEGSEEPRQDCAVVKAFEKNITTQSTHRSYSVRINKDVVLDIMASPFIDETGRRLCVETVRDVTRLWRTIGLLGDLQRICAQSTPREIAEEVIEGLVKADFISPALIIRGDKQDDSSLLPMFDPILVYESDRTRNEYIQKEFFSGLAQLGDSFNTLPDDTLGEEELKMSIAVKDALVQIGIYEPQVGAKIVDASGKLAGCILSKHEDDPIQWTGEQRELLQIVAKHFTQALQINELTSEMLEEREKDQILSKIDNILAEQFLADNLNERILIETQQALNCLTVGILFLDDRDRVFRVFAEDVPGPAAESIREGQPYSVGILSRALRTDKPQFVEDTHYDPDFSSFRNWALNQPMSDATRNYLQAIRSDVTIPLGDIGGYKMFLELIYDQPREFDRGYREFVMHVASRVSIALRRSQHMATLEARAFLYQRLADVGLLAKGFAHEMRGPLNVITNEVFQAEGTIKGLAGSDDELVKIQRNFGSIKGSVVQAEDVIFSLHRLSANGAELGLTDCNDIIRELLTDMQRSLDGLKIRTEVCLDDRIPELEMKRASLKLVFQNVLTNAIQAFDDMDGGLIKIGTKYNANEKRVHIMIQDNGKGMSLEAQHDAFMPFYTTRRHKGGRGLGLTLVHESIFGMGGEIHIESEEGRGTKLTLKIPWKEGEKHV